jgi:drug/metabolite transporter (DMT)-like permease
MAASIPLALVAALLFAVSAALQQHSARSTARHMEASPPRTAGGTAASRARVNGTQTLTMTEPTHEPPGPVRTSLWKSPVLLFRLLRDPRWLLGWLAGIGGFGAQAVALHVGSITVVQALTVTQLLFALPLGTIPAGRRPLRRDWLGAAAVCAGLITLLTIRGNVPQTTGRRDQVPLVVAMVVVLIALLVLVAWLLRSYPQSRTAALAAAAGLCFCLTAVFLVYAGDDLSQQGVLGAAFGWPLAGLIGSTLLGTVFVQNAFAGGSLPTAMTTMTITDPVASWIAGIVLFDAKPALGPGGTTGTVLAFAAIALGIAALATSPTLHDERHLRLGP